MVENIIIITKRNYEEPVPVINWIAEAMCQMFETLSDWGDPIDDIRKNAKIAFYTALHSIWHCIVNGFPSRRRKERKSRHIHHASIMVTVLIPSVHTTTITFSSFAILIREVYLQRTQDRGSDDPSFNGYFSYIALPII